MLLENKDLIYLVFGIVFSVLSFFVVPNSYAQTSPVIDEEIVFSDSLLNDPVAQDILKKIEQTKKMIKELEEKQFEENQAQENLKKMRQLSVDKLNQDLKEWERLWEKHTSRNAFETFVNKKPEYVRGVFWDQFEFKEKKVQAGRTAMNKVLMNGGTFYQAQEAYERAAATKKVELIEMNAQFNVKHNLAYYGQQQLFNSTGQFHPSPAAEQSIAEYFTDYRLDPIYLLANPDDEYSAKFASQEEKVDCREDYVLVHRENENDYVCIREQTAEMWERHDMGSIVDKIEPEVDENSMVQNVPTNPGTDCMDGYRVLYNVLTSEYQCVSESTAEKWLSDGTGEIHDLIDYILGKDQLKIVIDEIYSINQEVKRITEEYDLYKNSLEKQFNATIKHEEQLTQQKMQEIIKEYSISDTITKEDVSKQISELRTANNLVNEKIIKEKSSELDKLEINFKNDLLNAVKGYENHPDIDVDWDYLGQTQRNAVAVSYEESPVTSTKKNIDDLSIDNLRVINSFGKEFDEIKTNQILQVAGDLTNNNDDAVDFVYLVQITDQHDNLVQPAKWMTGNLDSDQTLNVGLSWIPEKSGKFTGSVFVGPDTESVSHIGDVDIVVNSQKNISSEEYCKKDYELLFKYSDNSPICATTDTASKLIKVGLAFS